MRPAGEKATVLLLGGTGEARRLAGVLAARPSLRVVTSLAGRVQQPMLPAGEVRVGGFGGVDALTEWLRRQRVAAVVDATHPFATRISDSAVAAAARAGAGYLALTRPAWSEQPGDRWCRVASMEEAAQAVAEQGHRVFLTIGRQSVAVFAHLERQWFLIRSVNPPDPPLPRHAEITLDRGPFELGHERELLERHRIDLLVTKNSGGPMTDAKLAAARALGMTVVMLERPAPPDGPLVFSVEAAVAWLDDLLAAAR